MTWPWAREFFRGTRISRRGGIPRVRAVALAGFRKTAGAMILFVVGEKGRGCGFFC